MDSSLTDQEIANHVKAVVDKHGVTLAHLLKAVDFLGLCANYGHTVDEVLAGGVGDSDHAPKLLGELYQQFYPQLSEYSKLK